MIENDKIIVFLNNQFIIKDDLDDYFRHILILLNKKYDIALKGYYNADVYEDKKYGMILELKYEDMDYYNYFDQVDININIINNEFLYKIKYEFLDVVNNVTCYKYLGDFYIKADNAVSGICEVADVIYGEQAKKVFKYGKKVNI